MRLGYGVSQHAPFFLLSNYSLFENENTVRARYRELIVYIQCMRLHISSIVLIINWCKFKNYFEIQLLVSWEANVLLSKTDSYSKLISTGIPFVFVVITLSASFDGYGTDRRCAYIQSVFSVIG